jgi:hypothetical protein
MEATFDRLIDEAHEAAQKAESDARAAEDRIRLVAAKNPELRGWMAQRRGHGEIRNPWQRGRENLTAQSILRQADPALASFLSRAAGATLPGPDLAKEQADEAAARQIAAMVESTEQLRAVNERNRKAQEIRTTEGFVRNGQWVRRA